jgi:hypothetical protein
MAAGTPRPVGAGCAVEGVPLDDAREEVARGAMAETPGGGGAAQGPDGRKAQSLDGAFVPATEGRRGNAWPGRGRVLTPAGGHSASEARAARPHEERSI